MIGWPIFEIHFDVNKGHVVSTKKEDETRTLLLERLYICEGKKTLYNLQKARIDTLHNLFITKSWGKVKGAISTTDHITLGIIKDERI